MTDAKGTTGGHNYCRNFNPAGDSTMTCYTTENPPDKPDWGYCDAKKCDESYSGNGYDYRGCKSTTVSGKTCIPWVGNPYLADATRVSDDAGTTGHHNFCRNPSNDAGGLWCYVTGHTYVWDWCDMPKKCDESYTGGGSNYRGCQTKTKSGRLCKAWN